MLVRLIAATGPGPLGPARSCPRSDPRGLQRTAPRARLTPWMSCSRARACARPSATASPSTAWASRSRRVRPTACWDPTAPARPPRSPWCAGCSGATPGRVTLQGRELDTGTVEVKAAVGFVPQEIAIYPDLTARENLRFFGKLYGLSGADLDAPDRPHPRHDRPGRPGERAHRRLLGRHEAAAEHRAGHAERPGAAGARRADRGRGSAEPQRDPGLGRGARVRGHGRPLHHALHGGGRAPVRPRGHPGRGRC